MKREVLSVAVVVLFFGLAFSIPINANVSKSSLEPVPDLDCVGDLYWIDVVPGATVTGSFTVENIGEPFSLLDWEIESFPDWGIWTLDPDGWTGLLPVVPVLVDVEVVLPDEIEDDLMGEVLIVNLENSSDYCIIDAWIRVKSIDDATPTEFELQRIRDLVQSIDLRKIIVNPDGALETLEEISTIIEENEDCGCEDDNEGFEWFFPMICTLLLPAWGVAVWIFFASRRMIWQPAEIMAQIGESLNCYWLGGSPWSK